MTRAGIAADLRHRANGHAPDRLIARRHQPAHDPADRGQREDRGSIGNLQGLRPERRRIDADRAEQSRASEPAIRARPLASVVAAMERPSGSGTRTSPARMGMTRAPATGF